MADSKVGESRDGSYDLLGITLTGAQAQMGQLIANQLRYEMAFRQLRTLHPKNLVLGGCRCGRTESGCETRRVLNTLEEMNGLKL